MSPAGTVTTQDTFKNDLSPSGDSPTTRVNASTGTSGVRRPVVPPVDTTEDYPPDVKWVSTSVASLELHRMRREALAELQRYLEFDRGWDGYDGEVFSRDTVAQAQQLVELSARFFERNGEVPSEITPGPASDGTVDVELEYHGRRLIFTLDPEQQPRVYATDEEQEAERSVQLNRRAVGELLRWLSGTGCLPSWMGTD